MSREVDHTLTLLTKVMGDHHELLKAQNDLNIDLANSVLNLAEASKVLEERIERLETNP